MSARALIGIDREALVRITKLVGDACCAVHTASKLHDSYDQFDNDILFNLQHAIGLVLQQQFSQLSLAHIQLVQMEKGGAK